MKKFNIITVIRMLKNLIKFIDMVERNRVCKKITKVQYKNANAAYSTLRTIERTIEVLKNVQSAADNKTAQTSKDLAKYLTDLSNA